MARTYQYRMQVAPSSRLDGSGMVDHDIYKIYSEDAGVTWPEVPGLHKTIQVPAAELKVVLDTPGTGNKVAAYKQALASNLNTQGVPITGWGDAQCEAKLDANEASALEKDRAITFITVTLGKTFPLEFGA